ncbi:hypothetical protein GOBAR_AA25811 [Gossypium barbadense]|uniref:Uncharacterized protein n=1 Tax=Gossypium barbadense TaxID=3634 RepID=A0A2P5WUT2_GOSBA|nr:hypothetical protein GOBAR_AA25811 [Gossypium barbadense]
MDSKKSNKIGEIVRLQQIVKKWKKLANASKKTTNTGSGGGKSMKFFKRTLSFNDVSAATTGYGGEIVPKGFLAVCVDDDDVLFFRLDNSDLTPSHQPQMCK